MFDDLIAEYNKLEPEGADSWNPLDADRELWHRVRLLIAIKWALQQIPIPISELKILDVGCGVGRSTRALLEFGVNPKNILGIDLRPSAIGYAKSINPAIPFQVVESFGDWPRVGTYHLCMQCTVFSSIKGNEGRLLLSQKMEEMVVDSGFIFWWDRILANDFAGADKLDPLLMFRKSVLLNKSFVSLKPSIHESFRSRANGSSLFYRSIQKYLGHRPSHLMAVFKKCQTDNLL